MCGDGEKEDLDDEKEDGMVVILVMMAIFMSDGSDGGCSSVFFQLVRTRTWIKVLEKRYKFSCL